jgi:hypothetical protein
LNICSEDVVRTGQRPVMVIGLRAARGGVHEHSRDAN